MWGNANWIKDLVMKNIANSIDNLDKKKFEVMNDVESRLRVLINKGMF